MATPTVVTGATGDKFWLWVTLAALAAALVGAFIWACWKLSRIYEIVEDWENGREPREEPEETIIDVETTPAPETAMVSSPIPKEKPAFHFSEDFRVVIKDGVTFQLTTNQSLVIQRLWDAHESHIPELHQTRLFEETDSCNYRKRLRDIFKSRMDAFKALIDKGQGRGCFRLKLA